MKALLALLALLPAIASAQWQIERPTLAACEAAAAAIAGPAGGSIVCKTTSARTIVVPPAGISVACEPGKDHVEGLRTAILAAKAKGLPVLLPAAVCAYSDVLTLDGVRMVGKGDASVLYAIHPSRSAVFVRGSGAELRSVKLHGVSPGPRSPAWEGSRVVVHGATSWLVDNVTIDGAQGAGIIVAQASSHGVISNNRVSNTNADSIHITDKSQRIIIVGNRVDNSGDDGVAVVSYRPQGAPVRFVTAIGNTISNNRSGRSMSVVGGEDVLYEHNRLSNSGKVACLYLAQERSYDTLPVRNVTARFNTLTNCGEIAATDHAAVMVFSGGGAPNDGVRIERNDIKQSAAQVCLRAYGPQTGVVMEANRCTGATVPQRLPADVLVTPYASGAVGAR